MIDLITTFIIKLFLHDIIALQLRTLFAFFLGKYVFLVFLQWYVKRWPHSSYIFYYNLHHNSGNQITNIATRTICLQIGLLLKLRRVCVDHCRHHPQIAAGLEIKSCRSEISRKYGSLYA